MEIYDKTALQNLAHRQLDTHNEHQIYNIIIVKSDKDNDLCKTNAQWISINLGIDYTTASRTLKKLIQKDLIEKVYVDDHLYYRLSGKLKELVLNTPNPWALVNQQYSNLKEDYSFHFSNKKEIVSESDKLEDKIKSARQNRLYRAIFQSKNDDKCFLNTLKTKAKNLGALDFYLDEKINYSDDINYELLSNEKIINHLKNTYPAKENKEKNNIDKPKAAVSLEDSSLATMFGETKVIKELNQKLGKLNV